MDPITARHLRTTWMVWVVLLAVWGGCLLPGPSWLAPAGTAVLLVARLAPGGVRVLALALALVALGSGIAGARITLAERGPLTPLAAAGGQAQIRAAVVTDARPSQGGAWLLLRVASVDGASSGQRALLRVARLPDAPPLGAVVAFTATARPLEHEGFDAHLRRMHAVAAVAPVSAVRVVRPPPALLRATTAMRMRVREAAAAHLSPDPAALLSGLVTGDTVGLSVAAEETLVGAGLSHLVAVSGSNVALVLAGTVGAGALCRLGARGRRRAAVVALLWFTLLVRGEPSVLRAVGMALLVLAAQSSGRGYQARHTLAVAATLLLLVDPLLAGQLGFALSVLATAGVLLVGPALAAKLPGPRWLAAVAGATVGAQLGVAPVLLVLGGVPLGALPANLVAVPAAAVASAVGIVAALVAQAVAPVGAALAAVAGPALHLVLWAGRTFADGPSLRPEHMISPLAAAGAALVVLRRRLPRSAGAGAVVIVVLAVVAPWARPATVTSLSLTAFDVGQGDALLVEVPGEGERPGARMLVDGGPDEGMALRHLRDRRVSYLDAVVVSHPHADHTDGLPAVLSAVPVGALLVGPRPAHELDRSSPSAVAAEAVAAQHGVPVVRVAAGQRFQLGAATVEILGPPADGSLGREPNDNSLVLRVTSPDGVILLTGDAEVAAQTRLLTRPDLLRADIVKVPHHGGATNAPGFLTAVAADTAVIGVGADNTFGHPHPDVLAELDGAVVLRTDTAGTVTATTAP